MHRGAGRGEVGCGEAGRSMGGRNAQRGGWFPASRRARQGAGREANPVTRLVACLAAWLNTFPWLVMYVRVPG